ncbi:MAG: NINE protein [Firmicutes bacterium]|nr:NINE protein [Bacillota bacterium]
MEYKCNVCGNVFDDALGTCPACGSVVLNSAAQNDSAPQYQASEAQNEPQQQPNYQYGEQPNYQQSYQGQPNYQQPYQGQPNYQQPYQGQPNYQQPPYQGNPQGGYGYKDPNAKSKIAAGILGILLGAFGVHNFYLGYTGKAIAQLLITLLSCFTLCWVSEIWGLIEGIMILTGSIAVDATGRPLSD